MSLAESLMGPACSLLVSCHEYVISIGLLDVPLLSEHCNETSLEFSFDQITCALPKVIVIEHFKEVFQCQHFNVN